MEDLVSSLVEQINKQVLEQTAAQVTAEVNRQLGNININLIIQDVVKNRLVGMMNLDSLPEASIPHRSINFQGFKLNGDNIRGGIIEEFGSVGIEDRSTHVQMTLMDHAVAFEGPLWAPNAVIKGDLKVEGNLVLLGDVQEDSPGFAQIVSRTADFVKTQLNADLFSGFSNLLFDQIKQSGIELDTITQGGKDIVRGNQLGYHITDTNIQRLGVVKDFQTQGENLLSDTLYVTNKRIGVNTLDPSSALAVWDEEVEVTIGKRSKDQGHIGTPRLQRLSLGSNGNENIALETDGSVRVTKLFLGKVPMISGVNPPNIEGQQGQIIWNERPDLGGPIGWVCIGGHRWAKFGIIE